MAKRDEEQKTMQLLVALLEECRETQLVSKRELSQRTGVSRTAIRMIENGESQPTVYILLKISNGLGLDLWKLLKKAQTEARG